MDFRTLSLIALAIGPAAAIMVFVYARDVHDREPFGVLLMSFFWGCFSVVPAIILETLLPGIVPGSGGAGVISIAIYTFVIIAFSEEISKFIFLRYYSYRKRSFNEPFDGIIYAVMIGMGFATIENLMYVFGADTPQNQWATAGMRAITAVPAHAAFAIIMGYYVGLAKFNKKKEKAYLWQGILYATVLHGFYDFFLFQNISSGIAIGALISLIIGIRFSLKAMRMHRDRSPFKEQLVSALPLDVSEKPVDDDHYESPYKPS
jgi:RsiW-degrading membrane proteinase PrsW (M82 family)